MNERIKEILVQCQHESIDGPEYPRWTDLEKFAELIVKECMDLALREQKRYAEFPHRNLSECAVTVSNFRLLMKDYFGVKE